MSLWTTLFALGLLGFTTVSTKRKNRHKL
jgi:hypothetical protein